MYREERQLPVSDLEIEARARRLRAEAFADGLSRLGAWMRAQRQAPVQPRRTQTTL